jgi:hypothetical protein
MTETIEVQPLPKKTVAKRNGMNPHGFRNNSDSAKIVEIMIAGGLDRQDINEKVADAITTETRNGHRKNIPSLVSGLLARLEKRGYVIESSWKLIPPTKE